ncbi:hypothetical protein FS837_004027 [Tulasnella sp. UAMH 9824]|nr:hypothetical protein FS837_004027 [Tulasnella sp. UAMH 9824]
MASSKVPISRLPLPQSTHILTHHLNPDPVAKNVKELVELIKTQPSVLRKSRAAHESAHFFYMTPLPLGFPYSIRPPPDDITKEERAAYVEKIISLFEPLSEVPLAPSPGTTPQSDFKKYHSLEREHHPRELLSIAPTCLRDCFPDLDVGDSLRVMGDQQSETKIEEQDSTPVEASKAAREELVDILSGNSVLMSIPPEGQDARGYAPWSLRYSGHQFGSWAGQLGDGRAISILETPLPSDPDTTFELQLKGAGRTPFSRGADGLAVLRSSVREYLVAEAMQALRIPTTRSLSLISLPTIRVYREEVETAAIVCRVAESFIRIGNFQALNSEQPDVSYMFLGSSGGAFAQQPPNFEALRVLGEWVTRRVLKLDIKEGEPWAKKLVWECARRNALMGAGWQAQGFMHGVMNTDNISIMGLTIDYGPYAFMDIFDEGHICNHTDEGGRYAYKYQPTMIVYALRMLLKSLGPVIGYESEHGKAVPPGWTEDIPRGKLKTWTAEAEEELSDDLEVYIMETFADEYWRLMRQRLGLRTSQINDHTEIIQPLLALMQKHSMDFHASFRYLTTFRASWMSPRTADMPLGNDAADPLDGFLQTLLPSDSSDTAKSVNLPEATKEWLEYLQTYAARINLAEEQAAWKELAGEASVDGTPSGLDQEWETTREAHAKQYNPRFVLRQWVLEDLISTLQAEAKDAGNRDLETPTKGREALNKILHMCTEPFKGWGAEGLSGEALTDEEKEERRLCGTGPMNLMGFQCSCSS